MKAEILQKRIEKKLFKNGKFQPKYTGTIQFLVYGYFPHRIHLIHKSKLARILEGLDLLGMGCVYGNNAPRGGKVGDYIMLSPKSEKAIGPWRKWYQNQLCRESIAREKERWPRHRVPYKCSSDWMVLTNKNMIVDLSNGVSRR